MVIIETYIKEHSKIENWKRQELEWDDFGARNILLLDLFWDIFQDLCCQELFAIVIVSRGESRSCQRHPQKSIS